MFFWKLLIVHNAVLHTQVQKQDISCSWIFTVEQKPENRSLTDSKWCMNGKRDVNKAILVIVLSAPRVVKTGYEAILTHFFLHVSLFFSWTKGRIIVGVINVVLFAYRGKKTAHMKERSSTRIKKESNYDLP